MTTGTQIPSRAWYILAVSVFLLCAVGSSIFFFVSFLVAIRSSQQFLAPGKVTLEAPSPGRYVLWNDYGTVFNGQAYFRGRNLPNGLRVNITKAGSEKEIPITQGIGGVESTGGTTRSSVGDFEIAQPGSYVIKVAGSFEPRVFSVRRGLFSQFFFVGIGVVFLNILGWIGGLAIAILTFLKRRRVGAAW